MLELNLEVEATLTQGFPDDERLAVVVHPRTGDIDETHDEFAGRQVLKFASPPRRGELPRPLRKGDVFVSNSMTLAHEQDLNRRGVRTWRIAFRGESGRMCLCGSIYIKD